MPYDPELDRDYSRVYMARYRAGKRAGDPPTWERPPRPKRPRRVPGSCPRCGLLSGGGLCQACRLELGQ